MVTKNYRIVTNRKHALPAGPHTRRQGGERLEKNATPSLKIKKFCFRAMESKILKKQQVCPFRHFCAYSVHLLCWVLRLCGTRAPDYLAYRAPSGFRERVSRLPYRAGHSLALRGQQAFLLGFPVASGSFRPRTFIPPVCMSATT